MPMVSLGDMARHFVAQRDMSQLRNRLALVNQEVSQNRAADTTRHLQGRGDRLVHADAKIARLAAEVTVAENLGQKLKAGQTALGHIDQIRASLSTRLVGMPTASTTQSIAEAGAMAEGALRDFFASLATRHDHDYVFAGRASDQAPLAPIDDVLAALRSLAAAATSLEDLSQIAADFFQDPSGPFATWVYQGGTGPAESRDLGDGVQVGLGPRADDLALRNLFSALATGVLVAESTLPVAVTSRATALQRVGAALVDAGAGMAAITARLGMHEAQLEQIVTLRGAHRTGAEIMRNALVDIDQAHAISTLQTLQAQLEIQYTITGRIASLSLAGYLR